MSDEDIDRADHQRKELMEAALEDMYIEVNSCDECGEGPAYIYGDGCYCDAHKPRSHNQ